MQSNECEAMKRAPLCKHLSRGNCSLCDHEKMARLRKQVADLKARLKAQVDLAAFVGTSRVYTPEHDAAWDLAERAMNLKLKSWRKGGK